MKLLIINDFGTQGGGTENRVRTLIDYFLRKKAFSEIHVLQKPAVNQGKLKQIKFERNKVYYHPCSGGYLKSYRLAKEIIKRYGIDLVQAHNMMALTPMPVLAAKNLGKPVVWYVHDYWAMCALRNFIDPYNAMNKRLCGKPDGKRCNQCRKNPITSAKLWFWKKILNKADLAVATGKRIVDIYRREGILNDRWEIITPWIDPVMLESRDSKKTKKRNKAKGRNKDIIFVGSLIDYKGAWVAVKALRHVLQKIPKARLVLIGDEQHSIFRKRIDLIAKKENVSSNIDFLGKRDKKEIRKMLNQGGVFVCPTVCMESFGLNWAEAMSSGCPVVASAIGSIPEHVDGSNGLLFTPRNNKELASGIIKVMSNPDLARRLSKNGKLHAKKNFDIEINGKKILSLYNRILKV